jgi:hypothetical protein
MAKLRKNRTGLWVCQKDLCSIINAQANSGSSLRVSAGDTADNRLDSGAEDYRWKGLASSNG